MSIKKTLNKHNNLSSRVLLLLQKGIMKMALIVFLLFWPTTARGQEQAFHGYPCTKDCSGHKAGYKWAEKRDIDHPDDCGGKSNSFVEGCRIWAKQQQKEKPDAEEKFTPTPPNFLLKK